MSRPKIGKEFQRDVFIKMPRQKIGKVFQKDVVIKMPRQKIGKVFQKDVFIKTGLGRAFFPIQNVPVFPALLKNTPFFTVLFLSFW